MPFLIKNLNTTHVSVQFFKKLSIRTLSPFKYNPCIGSINSLRMITIYKSHLNTTHVSVQWQIFRYQCLYLPHLNTTHVSVQYPQREVDNQAT